MHYIVDQNNKYTTSLSSRPMRFGPVGVEAQATVQIRWRPVAVIIVVSDCSLCFSIFTDANPVDGNFRWLTLCRLKHVTRMENYICNKR